MTLYTVAGLNTQIELPVPLIVKLIPASQTNQRPGITRQVPGYWVAHETANYNAGAGAEMHWRYLAQGAGGQQLSYHFAVDDKVIYQMIPINEVTWQAADGGGPGNMSGISCELCVNRDADWSIARRNAESLAGGVMQALGMEVYRLKRHYDFNAADPNRHFCPKEMMTSGYWSTFVANVGKIIAGNVIDLPDVPREDDPMPTGMDKGIAEMLFGSVTLDGNVYSFNPRGPVSNVWLAHGKATGQWPELVSVRRYADSPTVTRTYFVFAGGYVIWVPQAGADPRELK